MPPRIFPCLSPLVCTMTKIPSVIQGEEVSEEEADVSLAISQIAMEDSVPVEEMEMGMEGIFRTVRVMTIAIRKT